MEHGFRPHLIILAVPNRIGQAKRSIQTSEFMSYSIFIELHSLLIRSTAVEAHVSNPLKGEYME